MITPLRTSALPRTGYGNIYTPHAGSMIIQVQRETGLANRTLILGPRQVRLLRIVSSRWTRLAAVLFVGTWIALAIQSARVPMLEREVDRLRADNQRMATLERRLTTLQSRYEQIRTIMSGLTHPAATTATNAAASTATTSTPTTAPR